MKCTQRLRSLTSQHSHAPHHRTRAPQKVVDVPAPVDLLLRPLRWLSALRLPLLKMQLRGILRRRPVPFGEAMVRAHWTSRAALSGSCQTRSTFLGRSLAGVACAMHCALHLCHALHARLLRVLIRLKSLGGGSRCYFANALRLPPALFNQTFVKQACPNRLTCIQVCAGRAMACALRCLGPGWQDPMPHALRNCCGNPKVAHDHADLLKWRDSLLQKRWVSCCFKSADAAKVQ